MLRCGFEPAKIYRIAKTSFAGRYSEEIILKWLKTFYRRFFLRPFPRLSVLISNVMSVTFLSDIPEMNGYGFLNIHFFQSNAKRFCQLTGIAVRSVRRPETGHRHRGCS